jgi:predicted kinase
VAALFLIVGLPGAGKTTRARELAAEHRALRLTPDEWMIPLFGEPDADGKRDVLEGRLIRIAGRRWPTAETGCGIRRGRAVA